MFDGDRTRRRVDRAIVRRSVIHMPQGRMLFGDDERAREPRRSARTWWRIAQTFDERLARVYELFPILKQRATQTAALPVRRRTADAGARARVDVEPEAAAARRALARARAETIRHDIDTVRTMNATGVSVLIAEQNARKVLRSPTTATCWRTARSPFTAPEPSCCATSASNEPIWERVTREID